MVHGLSDAAASAPTWPEVLPTLLQITQRRYNADFDHGVIRADCHRHGLDPAHLAGGDTWGCVMNRRSDWARMWRWLPLAGEHRALGDTHVTRDVLHSMNYLAGGWSADLLGGGEADAHTDFWPASGSLRGDKASLQGNLGADLRREFAACLQRF